MMIKAKTLFIASEWYKIQLSGKTFPLQSVADRLNMTPHDISCELQRMRDAGIFKWDKSQNSIGWIVDVELLRERIGVVRNLFYLLGSNSKLSKPVDGESVSVRGLTLAPHKSSGRQVCPMATAGCAASCVLEFTGMSVVPSVKAARQRKTDLCFDDRPTFLLQLVSDIALHVRRCNRSEVRPHVRLNTASDIEWERIAPIIFALFPDVEFYDYTKIGRRFTDGRHLPSNYSLSYSASERDREDGLRTVDTILESGGNVVIVCDAEYNGQRKVYGPLPDCVRLRGWDWLTVDGDVHDVRTSEFDGTSRVVLLRFKGSKARKTKALADGFVFTCDELTETPSVFSPSQTDGVGRYLAGESINGIRADLDRLPLWMDS